MEYTNDTKTKGCDIILWLSKKKGTEIGPLRELFLREIFLAYCAKWTLEVVG